MSHTAEDTCFNCGKSRSAHVHTISPILTCEPGGIMWYISKTEVEAKANAGALLKFKNYVHERLDNMGIPQDPTPGHSCRIGERLNIIEAQAKELRALKEDIDSLLAVIHRDGGHYQYQHGYKKALADANQIVTELIHQEK